MVSRHLLFDRMIESDATSPSANMNARGSSWSSSLAPTRCSLPGEIPAWRPFRNVEAGRTQNGHRRKLFCVLQNRYCSIKKYTPRCQGQFPGLSRISRKIRSVSLRRATVRGGPEGASPESTGAARAERRPELRQNRERVEKADLPRGVSLSSCDVLAAPHGGTVADWVSSSIRAMTVVVTPRFPIAQEQNTLRAATSGKWLPLRFCSRRAKA